MTQAERGRLEAKEKKRAEEDCFEFLKDLRDVSPLSALCDSTSLCFRRNVARRRETLIPTRTTISQKEKNRPGDPEYDPRTVFIPNKAWSTFSPFEKQFWEIKQNHFDTVLFFQKVRLGPNDPPILARHRHRTVIDPIDF